jgi:hypothetical protein
MDRRQTVADRPARGASVFPAACELRGSGHTTLWIVAQKHLEAAPKREVVIEAPDADGWFSLIDGDVNVRVWHHDPAAVTRLISRTSGRVWRAGDSSCLTAGDVTPPDGDQRWLSFAPQTTRCATENRLYELVLRARKQPPKETAGRSCTLEGAGHGTPITELGRDHRQQGWTASVISLEHVLVRKCPVTAIEFGDRGNSTWLLHHQPFSADLFGDAQDRVTWFPYVGRLTWTDRGADRVLSVLDGIDLNRFEPCHD